MEKVFFLARFFPFWGIPLLLVLFEMGRQLKRKGRPKFWLAFVGCGLTSFLLVFWFIFRGDIYSDRWIKSVVE